MRQFTKEELDFLKNYENNFKTAINSGYSRNVEPRYANQIKAIYDAATGGDYGLNASCSHCMLTFLKAVGHKYFEDLDAYNAKAAQLVEALDEVFGDVPDEEEPQKPKKRGRKPSTK